MLSSNSMKRDIFRRASERSLDAISGGGNGEVQSDFVHAAKPVTPAQPEASQKPENSRNWVQLDLVF